MYAPLLTVCVSTKKKKKKQNSKDNEAVEKVMNDLDANNDGEVDFTEFIILMGALTVACNDFFLEYKTDEKPKDEKKE